MRRLIGAALAVLVLFALAAWSQDLKSLDAQMTFLARQGRWSEALPIAQQYVDLARRTQGPDSPDLATGLSNLGAVYTQLGNLTKALESLKEAVRIRQKVFGQEDVRTAATLYNLGNVYQALGDHVQAEENLLRCLKIRDQLLGPTHPETRAVLEHLSLAARQSGDFMAEQEYSERLSRTAAGPKREVLPAPSPEDFLSSANPAPTPTPAGGPPGEPPPGSIPVFRPAWEETGPLVRASDPMQQRMAIDEYQSARLWEDRHDFYQATLHYQRCLVYAMNAYPEKDWPRADFGGEPLARIARRALELDLTVLKPQMLLPAGTPVKVSTAHLVSQVHNLYRKLETLEPHNPSWLYLDAVVWTAAGNYMQANRLLDKAQKLECDARLQDKILRLKGHISEGVALQAKLAQDDWDRFRKYYESGAWLPNSSASNTAGPTAPSAEQASTPDWERRARDAQAHGDTAAAGRFRSGGATCEDCGRYW